MVMCAGWEIGGWGGVPEANGPPGRAADCGGASGRSLRHSGCCAAPAAVLRRSWLSGRASKLAASCHHPPPTTLTHLSGH